MIVITGSVRVAPAYRAEAIALGIEHSVRSRGDPGCIAHNCHVDVENEDRIVFLELWADMAAVQAHFAVPESGAFVRALTGMALAVPEMHIYQASELARP